MATNLRKFRAFDEAYPQVQRTLSAESGSRTALSEIRQTLSVESTAGPALAPTFLDALASQFKLG